MKKLFTIIILSFSVVTSYAQNMGIGTNTPNASAMLDINSTTKGVLLPRMTTLQRFAINTPPNGLLVYDTDKNGLYQYNGTAWTPILNGDYWIRGITTRDRIGNLADSVGIGTFSPTNRLDVNGNIRSRDDILADGRVIATGIVSGSGLQTSGSLIVSGTGFLGGNFTTNGTLNTNSNLTVDGTSTLTGDVTTTGDIVVNNATGTLQLRNGSNVNKGFVQLSADNLRLGTNSGNTQSVIFRLNGNDRTTMYANGDINIEGKITKQAETGFSNLLPLAYGRVDIDGNKIGGTPNISVTKLSTGLYSLYIPQFNPTTSTILITTEFKNIPSQALYSIPDTQGRIFVEIFNPAAFNRLDSGFSFIVYQ